MLGIAWARGAFGGRRAPALMLACGVAAAAALVLREPLARWMRRPLAWATVAIANLSAMTLFLWHQTAFISVTMLGLPFGRLPGLDTAPSSLAWVAERLAWLPAFAVALALLWTVAWRAEHASGLPGRIRTSPAPFRRERPALDHQSPTEPCSSSRS